MNLACRYTPKFGVYLQAAGVQVASLQDFYDTVDEAIGEGGATDSRIVIASRLSMRRLERLFNFRYMRTEVTKSMVPTAAGAGSLDLGDGIKTILSGELRPSGGGVVSGEMPLTFVDNPVVRLDDKRFEGKFPVYVRGVKTAVPLYGTTKDQDFFFLVLKFTQDWGSPDAASYTHPLVNQLEDLFLADVCMHLLPITRDADLQAFSAQRDESVKSLFSEGYILSTEDWQ